MAVTATRNITIQFSGDISAANTFAAANNVGSPGEIELQALASGSNTITPPTGAKAVTIIPPTGNTVLVTLKGVTGDTGVVLHPTDPSSVALNAAASTFCLTAASAVTVRLIWS
jgi:hypothetical protein